MPWHARALGCWRTEASCSSELGSRLSGRRQGLKGGLCHSSGLQIPPRQASQLMIAGGLTSSFAVLPRAARPYAATRPSCSQSDVPLACSRGGPHRLCVLAAERRWNDDSQHVVRRLVALRARRFPATLRGAASQGWARRRRGVLAVAAQRAACSAVLGIWTMPPLPNAHSELPLAEALHLAADSAPSRLPLRLSLGAPAALAARLIPLAARLVVSLRPDHALHAA